MGESGHVAGCCGKIPNRQANSGSIRTQAHLRHLAVPLQRQQRVLEAFTISVHNRHPPYQTPNSAQQPLSLKWSRWSLYEPTTCFTGVATYTRIKQRQMKQSKTKQNVKVQVDPQITVLQLLAPPTGEKVCHESVIPQPGLFLKFLSTLFLSHMDPVTVILVLTMSKSSASHSCEGLNGYTGLSTLYTHWSFN